MVAHVVTVLFSSFIIYTAWPGSSLFSWHPTMMALAFVGCMFEALLVYNPESSLFLNAKHATKVLVHQVLGISAVVCSYLGFAAIFYNKSVNDKPHFTTWHGLFGVTTLVAVTLQSFGGDLVKYEWLRSIFRLKSTLFDLKIYHATAGLITFTLVTVTLMLGLYSNWFVSQVGGVLWWPCLGCVSFMAVVVMNRVVSEYLPRTRRPRTAVATKAAGSQKNKSATKAAGSKKNK